MRIFLREEQREQIRKVIDNDPHALGPLPSLARPTERGKNLPQSPFVSSPKQTLSNHMGRRKKDSRLLRLLDLIFG